MPVSAVSAAGRVSTAYAFPKPGELVQEDFSSEVVVGGKKVRHEYRAWPKQAMAHRARARYVCFGGARGPGKTVVLVEAAMRIMCLYPGIPILLLRKDLLDLKKTTMVEFARRCPREFYDPANGGQWNKGEHWVRFWNGSICYFGEGKDWESYKSMTVGWIGLDELNEFEDEFYLNLDPTLRWTTGEGLCDRPECKMLGEAFVRDHNRHPFYQIFAATNPAPGWVKERFYDPWKAGSERPNHAFIAATSFDNPSLPPDFIPRLLENHTATWVHNYVYGDWSAFENMVWGRFNRITHGWRQPIPHTQFVKVGGGIDYGGTTGEAHRTAAYITGQTAAGNFITFWEYSKQGGASKDFFATIRAVNRLYRVQRWDADASQHRANELLRDSGVNVQDAPRYKGAVRDGLNAIDRELEANRVFVSEGNCPRLVSGIESYQLDPQTGEPAKNQDDDEVNAWRYNMMWMLRDRGALPNSQGYTIKGFAGAAKRPESSRLMDQYRKAKQERNRRMYEKAGIGRD